MADRRWVVDSRGVEWAVFVRRTPAARGMAATSSDSSPLRFESGVQARHLRAGEYPENWASLSDKELEALLDQAGRLTVSALVPATLHYDDGTQQEHMVSNPAPDTIALKSDSSASSGAESGHARTGEKAHLRRFERRKVQSRDGVVHYFEIVSEGN
jgi:hypothetical protein